MAQLCVYLDDTTMARLRADSGEANRSLSRYVSDLINEQREKSAWPEGFWDVYGALGDETFRLPADLAFSDDDALPAF